MGTSDGRIIGTTKIIDNGPASQRWNLVIMSEGYRESEMATFAADARNVADNLLTIAPFDQLRRAINVFRVDVASTDSGADDPNTCGGGTGRMAATFFDATFCFSNIRRLLVANNMTAFNVANAQVPQHHMIMIIVNSNIFGGSGGSVAVFSKASNAVEIALHEMGHTAFKLADEYEYLQGCGNETDHDNYSGAEPIEANVTKNPNRATIKWGHLISPATAMPTTSNADCRRCDPQPSPVPAGVVGAFEGGRYFHCKIFRPEFNCRMRNLNAQFCAVCQDRIRRVLTPFMPPPRLLED